jgi:hypothetical protein
MLCIAPLFILVLTAGLAADLDGDTTASLSFLVPCLIVAALSTRVVFGYDVVVHEDCLVYRAAWRNYRIDRASVRSVQVEPARSSSGLANLMVVNVHQRGGQISPLKLFGCFRPTAESPSPIGYQRMLEMARELSTWATSPPPGPESASPD